MKDPIFDIDFIRPRRHPKHGPVFRLMLDYIACDEAGRPLAQVFVHPKRYPKQYNPHWRIDVEREPHCASIISQEELLDHAVKIGISNMRSWLAVTAPVLAVETVTWPQLVRLVATGNWRAPSPYGQRKRKSLVPAMAPRRPRNYVAPRKTSALTIDLD